MARFEFFDRSLLTVSKYETSSLVTFTAGISSLVSSGSARISVVVAGVSPGIF